MRQISNEESSRLTIDLPLNMHRIVKAHATLSNLSIKDFVIEAISEKLDEEEIMQKKLNKETIAVLRNSLKNEHKLKSFVSLEDMMNYLNGPSKKSAKSSSKSNNPKKHAAIKTKKF